jgi:hypothetical protein
MTEEFMVLSSPGERAVASTMAVDEFDPQRLECWGVIDARERLEVERVY